MIVIAILIILLLVALVALVALVRYEKFTQLTLELADTPEKRDRGLMFRKHIPANHGMLFVYPVKNIHKMWMKNTYIPLDLLYLSDDFKIIGIERDLQPHSLQLRGLDIPTKFIIEVGASNASNASNFKIGQKIDYVIKPGHS